MAATYYYGKGKRKTSTAKVRLYAGGKGEIVINGKDLNTYVSVKDYHDSILAPLRVTNTAKQFNLSIIVDGGGIRGQADAIRHGIAKALLAFDAELKSTLRKEGFLTRDSRKKERKKPGLKRARRASQFSKR